MKIKNVFFLVLIIMALFTTACEKEGAGEKAGKAFDKALGSAKDKIDETTK